MKSDVESKLLSPPFVYTRPTVFTLHLFIIVLLSVQVLVLLLLGDIYAVLNILSSIIACFAVDLLVQKSFSYKFKFNIDVLTTAMLIGFFMPSQIGFLFVFFLSAFSFFLTKIVFGGTGSNWINPVAVALCMAYISRPEVFSNVIYLEDIKNAGGIFPLLKNAGLLKLKSDFSITSALNALFLHSVGVTLPEGYISLFLNYGSPIPAFRYNLITLLSSIVLFSFKAVDYLIPTVFLVCYGLLIWIFGGLAISGTFFTGDILFALLTSGVLFAAIFVMTESSSTAKTKVGKMICGFLNALFAFFICRQGASPAGIAFVIILTNSFTPLIEKVEVEIQRRRRYLYE